MTPVPGAFVDANVILRFLTGTPSRQAEAAARLFARAQRRDVDLHLLPLVVAEVVYVLASVYGYDSERIHGELAELIDTECFRVRDGDAIRRALATRATANVDFVDAYLAELARFEGLEVATFDRDFDRLGAARMRVT